MAQQGFSGTVVGGIQDISAILPLLGTEQCEEHVGSALERGFLYCSVTPISIFGSLGIVRAGFNILVASINISTFGFLGAEELKDGGFDLKGDIAPMIGFDRRHPRRFLAESKLETMLAEEHIQNAEDLAVFWPGSAFLWNIILYHFGIIFSFFGLLPYIDLIREFDHPHNFLPTGWGFPVLRVLGSALCVIISQHLIQIRIMIILKTRLLFMTIDQYSVNSTPVARVFSEFKKKKKHLWSADLSSERCIWELERWLLDSKTQYPEEDHLICARKFYESKFIHHFGTMDRDILTALQFSLSFYLAIGILLTTGGYVGCFYLVQNATSNSRGPLLWLGLEVFLSLVRIFVWGRNPSWDDPDGVVFKLKLARPTPLITCTKSHREILEDGLIPVTRAEEFLQDLVAYTGPLSLVTWNNVELYYLLKADDTNLSSALDFGKDIPGILYIIVYNYKEQRSRLVFKDASGRFLIYFCVLVFGDQDNTINAKVDFDRGATEENTHSFTADKRAMHELESHYNSIISLLSDPSKKRDRFNMTWAMMPKAVIQEEEERSQISEIIRYHLASVSLIYSLIYSLAFSSFKKETDIELGSVDNKSTDQQPPYVAEVMDFNVFTSGEWDNLDGNDNAEEARNNSREDNIKYYFLTPQDKALLRQAHLENRCSIFRLRMVEWIERYMKFFENQLDEERPIPTDDKIEDWIRDAEAREARIVLGCCLSSMAAFFDKIERQLCEFLETKYDNMVAQISIQPFRGSTPVRPMEAEEQYRYHILKNRLAAAHAEQLKIQQANNMERKLSWSKLWGKDTTEFPDMNRPWDEIEGDLKRSLSLQLSQAQGNVGKQSGAPVKDSGRTLTQFRNHCEERIEELVYRLKSQQQEFDDASKEMISIVSGPATSQEADSTKFERSYWTEKSLEERLRMLQHKYLYLEPESCYAVGGPQNLARALRRSRPFAFIDFDRVEEQMAALGIVSAIQDLKSVTGVYCGRNCLELREREVIEGTVDSNVQHIAAEEYDVCKFTGFQLDGTVPRSLHVIDQATCTVTFRAKNPDQDHVLVLKYRCQNDPGQVRFALNGHNIVCNLQACSDFVHQNILLPASKLVTGTKEVNTVTISFPPPPEGDHNYMIADVFLPVLPIPPHKICKESEEGSSDKSSI